MITADQTPVPPTDDLEEVREAARGCRACPIWRNATQTVFGDGDRSAKVLFVGEQPGDVEDQEGKPFVGPAGRVLDEALSEAGISRRDCYVTNAVKHFKWEPSGKRRIHKKPSLARSPLADHGWRRKYESSNPKSSSAWVPPLRPRF